MKILKIFFGLILLIFLANCENMDKKVDLIVYSSKIYTLDQDFSIAQAMAIKNGKIIAIGTNDEIFDNYTAHNVYNGIGKTIYPGFIDGHCHFYGYGKGLLSQADLQGTKSFDEVIERVKAHQNEHNMEWIVGRGWDQNDWPEKSFPTKTKLDELFPDNPVVLIRIDGHAVVANSVALEKAGINKSTKIEGGEVLLGNDGFPNGMLIDNAADAVKNLIPELSPAKQEEALLLAQKNCFAVGLTSIVDAGLDKDLVCLIDTLQKAGKLKMKINAMLSPNAENLNYFVEKGPYLTDNLSVRSIKLYADGALGSRGALLHEPYSDDPGKLGLQMSQKEYFRDWAKKAYDNNYQICTHAIGDSAGHLMLDLYGEILGGQNDRRWRIEHAQIIRPQELPKFKAFSIIPSVQATHCTSDMYWAGDRIGQERIAWAYAYQDLLKQNGWLINGTDFPIESINPLYTFYASVARKDLQAYPEGGFQKENGLSREQSLKSMTIWAAKGSFEEKKKGSLEVGKFADFVILEKDIMEIPEAEIPTVGIVRTYANGEEVYHNEAFGY
jgi:predicted amidohydrolase YtcJ